MEMNQPASREIEGASPVEWPSSEGGAASCFKLGGGVNWGRCCEGMALVSEAAAWSAEMKGVYQNMVDAVAEAVECSQVHLHLVDYTGDCFVRKAYHADVLNSPAWTERLEVSVGRLKWMMRTGRPLITDFANPCAEDRIPEEAADVGAKVAVSIPLSADGTFLGACTVVYGTEIAWDDDRLSYLMLIGRIMSVAIRRMQMTKNASQLKILDERKRLSAEIYDNVAHLVGSLSLGAAAAMASLDEGDERSVRADLDSLERLASKTMRILRDEMMSLRIPLKGTEGLVDGARLCLERFERNWGIEVSFEVESLEDPLMVPLEMSLQLTRIMNESLSNVLRHAEATHVSVRIAKDARCLSMTIEDNGKGFDVDAVPAERMGLRIMDERAEAVGGKLTVVSGPRGTAVCVDIALKP